MSKRMSIEEYTRKAAEKLGGEYKEIEKANGVIKHGIVISTDTNMSPTVYTDGAYETRIGYPSFVKRVREQLKNMPVMENPANKLGNYDGFVKERLKARLYNRKTNADVYISAAPYGFDDLIIIPYIQFDDNASIKVTNLLMQLWGKEYDEVISTALENSKDFELTPMYEVLVSLGFPLPEDVDIPLYVLSNKTRVCGAITAVTQRDMLKERFGEYKVIPSSIHEVLILPGDEDTEMDELTSMITHINEKEVLPEERLGDHAYQF